MKFFNKIKLTVFFLYSWLAIGFVLGTFILSVFIRSLLTYLRSENLSSLLENIIIIIIILVYITLSLFITKWFYIWLAKDEKKIQRFIFIVLITILFLFSLSYWFFPKFTDGSMVSTKDGRFTIGPYPDLNKMFKLKVNGYTTIVSLLNPKILPFEPYLIDQEIKNAKIAGLKIINIPMIPWISKNEDAIRQIENLAKMKNNEKYYVHCYYGEDRTRAFVRILSQTIPLKKGIPTKYSRKKNTLLFERGQGIHLDNKLYLTPQLTDEELLFAVNVIAPKTIISLLPQIYNQQEQNEKELVKPFGIAFLYMPIKDYPYDPIEMLRVANEIKTFPSPILVHEFYMPPQSIIAEGFMLSYITQLPALPSGLFIEPLTNGKVELIAPNIALGPSPIRLEFNTLKNRGVRSIAYIGICKGKQYNSDRLIAKSINLEWKCFSPNDHSLITALSNDGPWYTYGPELINIQDQLKMYFVNSIPENIKQYLKRIPITPQNAISLFNLEHSEKG